MASENPLVSVIVPVRNGRADLEQLVTMLENQSLPREQIEIVIGDDGSTDGATTDLETEDGWLRVVPGPPRNSYAARNRAVRASRGRVLAFCDADCRPEPDWIERGVAALELGDVVAGQIFFEVPAKRTVWTLLDMDSSKDHAREVKQGTAETANLFSRRELFDDIGGFEEAIPEYGDFDFVERCVAAGAKLVFAPDVVVRHPTRNEAKRYLRAVWIYNRGYAAREGRERRTPEALRLRSLVPLVQPLRARRRWGRTIGPDRTWLATNGVRSTAGETLRALPIMYLLIPYLSAAAQFVGWRDGRSLRPRSAAARSATAAS